MQIYYFCMDTGVTFDDNLADKRYTNVALMLAHRIRRRPSTKTTFSQRLEFAGNVVMRI